MQANELTHYGVIGMKWGVKKNRNTSSRRSTKKKTLFKSKKKTIVKNNKTNKKTVSNLSDAELKEIVSRLELEKKYKDLHSKSEQAKMSKGKSFVNGMVNNVLIPAATEAGKQYVKDVLLKTVLNTNKKK